MVFLLPVWALTIGLLLSPCQCQYQMTCQTAVGDFRDCTCGVRYRDLEQRCCSDLTCLKPVALSENFTCPFICENGGTYNAERSYCLCPEGYGGLCCEKESVICGDILLTPTGKITNRALSSRTNVLDTGKCTWRVSTDPMRRVALGAFNLNSTAFDCQSSYLAVYDGENSSSPLVGKFCKTKPFETTFSTNRHIYVEYRYTAPKVPFELHYVTFYAGQQCGPVREYWRSTDIITSPQYPFEYRPNWNCSWEIRVQNQSDLIITILELDIPATSLCSEGDKLVLSRKQQSSTDILKVICGKEAPVAYRIRGVSRLLLQFSSNHTVQGKGFKIRYEQIPYWV